MNTRFCWPVRPLADHGNVVSGRYYRFTVLSPCLLRMEYSSEGVFEDRASQVAFYRDFPKTDFRAAIAGDTLTIETDALILNYRVDAAFSESSLAVKLKIEPATTWRYGDSFETLGGTVRTLDQIDGRCALGDGVCSRNGFAILDDSNSLLLEDDGWIGVRQSEGVDCYFFGFGYDYRGAVKALYQLTGAPPLLPAYALGNWWSRYYAYSQEEYLALMDRFKAEDIPFSVGVADMDWHITDIPEELQIPLNRTRSGWTGYSWNKDLFPDYKLFLKELHNRNIKTSLNLHPAAGTCPHEDMYEEMARANDMDPATKQRVPLDLLSQKHMETYFDILHHPYEADGVDFWWMDWQQGTDYWWIHEPNKPGEYHDPRERMDPLWLLNHLHILDITRDGKRPIFFSRYAGPGSHRYPVGFSGDTIISWESLKFQPEFTATASNIGYSWWSHDIGGHTNGIHDHELYLRWLQLGVFSPINRLHSTKNRYMCKEPWNYPEPIRTYAGEWLRLRHKLFPYLYTMNYRNYKELQPLVQPMYYSHPKCHEAYTVPNQFWFGSELVAAPITEPNDPQSLLGRADVWLPQGLWFDFFSGLCYDGLKGRRLEVYRSLDRMPVFAKAGAIVPMANFAEGENRLYNSEKMELLVFPGAENCFELYEDGGEGNAFAAGDHVKTKLELKWGAEPAFVIHPAEGNRDLIPKVRTWKIGFRGFHMDAGIENAVWDAETNTTWITVSAATNETVRIELTGANLIHDNSDARHRIDQMILMSQHSHYEKDMLWDKLQDSGYKKPPTLKTRVCGIRSVGASVGKAICELLTLTEDI